MSTSAWELAACSLDWPTKQTGGGRWCARLLSWYLAYSDIQESFNFSMFLLVSHSKRPKRWYVDTNHRPAGSPHSHLRLQICTGLTWNEDLDCFWTTEAFPRQFFLTFDLMKDDEGPHAFTHVHPFNLPEQKRKDHRITSFVCSTKVPT